MNETAGQREETLREQAESILVYLQQDPDQTLVPDGRVRLLKRMLARPEPPEGPKLGLATTELLLQELLARAEVGGYAKYRTVGGEEIMEGVVCLTCSPEVATA